MRSKGEISTLPGVDVRSVTGTKEFVECSNHGICDSVLGNIITLITLFLIKDFLSFFLCYGVGTCSCFAGYQSSDWLGNKGPKGDCGYRSSFTQPYVAKNGQTYYTSCPFTNDILCGGHGQCNEMYGTCMCDEGYGERDHLT